MVGKRTVFLVKTGKDHLDNRGPTHLSASVVQLVEQQGGYIQRHTDLIVGKYSGDRGVDLWDKGRWASEFEEHQVLVFTSQVFLNLVDHNYFREPNSPTMSSPSRYCSSSIEPSESDGIRRMPSCVR